MYKVENKCFQDFNEAVEYARARAEKLWEGNVGVEKDRERILRIKSGQLLGLCRAKKSGMRKKRKNNQYMFCLN